MLLFLIFEVSMLILEIIIYGLICNFYKKTAHGYSLRINCILLYFCCEFFL